MKIKDIEDGTTLNIMTGKVTDWTTNFFTCPLCDYKIHDSIIAKHLASKGGVKAAQRMTKEQRVERAKKAVNARRLKVK